MNFILPYTSALLLGSVHALEADHMAAVTAFAVRKPAPLAAARFGIRWAMGHGAAVVLAGLLLLTAGYTLPAPLTVWLDRVVGFVLIILGLWTARHASRLHTHVHLYDGVAHAHLHSHAHTTNHEHANAATMVGALHGLAGAAPALAVLEITRLESMVEGLAYLSTFAAGTALGMAVYALVTGYFVNRAAVAFGWFARTIGRLAGVGTIVIGVIWLLR
jgi:ABC-type nickel/cobalt efflux system permease component RcnA